MTTYPPRFGALIPALFLLLLGGGVLWLAQSFPRLTDGYPGPALFPQIVAIGLLSCGALLGLSAFRNRQTVSPDSDAVSGFRWQLPAALALVGILPWIGPWLGLSLSCALLCLGMAFLLEIGWKQALILAGGTGGLVFLVFTLGLGIEL
jgi:putative tricarboxylic transport membrane protein